MTGEVVLRKWRVTLADGRCVTEHGYTPDHAARRALAAHACAPVAIAQITEKPA